MKNKERGIKMKKLGMSLVLISLVSFTSTVSFAKQKNEENRNVACPKPGKDTNGRNSSDKGGAESDEKKGDRGSTATGAHQ
jgi:hypothetical protein